MDYSPPTPSYEMVYCVQEKDELEQLRDIYEKYAEIIHPLNQSIFKIILEMKKFPENEEKMEEFLNLLFFTREEVIKFFGLDIADKYIVPDYDE